MEKIKFNKPVIDLKNTGLQIKSLRKQNGFSVHDIQDIFGFEYPQAVYSWEQGKNIPTIDNLLVLSRLFNVGIDEIVITRNVEVDICCSAGAAEKICNKNCESCKLKLSA